MPIYTLLLLAIPISWIISEFRGKVWHRITLGILTIAIFAFIISEARLVIPRYHEMFLIGSIETANDLLLNNRLDTVSSEFARYVSSLETNNNRYGAAHSLWIGLRNIKAEQGLEGTPVPGAPSD